jgi:predicted protein tyrosine phosphatase
MSEINRTFNAKNPFQGSYKKVLCVCSAGLMRSPTAALILSQEPYNYNTRAAGLVKEYALIYADDVLLGWCDEVVCMTTDQENELKARTKKPVICLNIPDIYPYRDSALIERIKATYKAMEP